MFDRFINYLIYYFPCLRNCYNDNYNIEDEELFDIEYKIAQL